MKIEKEDDVARQRSNSKDKTKSKKVQDAGLTKEQANIKNEMYTRLFGLKWKHGTLNLLKTHKVYLDRD